MAFYIVRLGPSENESLVCHGPASRAECEAQLEGYKKANEKFYPGSRTEIYKDGGRRPRAKPKEQVEYESEMQDAKAVFEELSPP